MIIDYLEKQIAWSLKTFGPGPRTLGVTNHIRKELIEVEASPADLEEWCDVMILAFDGAWRAGHSPGQIVDMLQAKQAKNFNRRYAPSSDQDTPTEHIREESPKP